jgi:hypothetical protein
MLLIVLPTAITTLATAIHQNHFAIAAKRERTVLLKHGRIQIQELETLIQVLETTKTLKTLIQALETLLQEHETLILRN